MNANRCFQVLTLQLADGDFFAITAEAKPGDARDRSVHWQEGQGTTDASGQNHASSVQPPGEVWVLARHLDEQAAVGHADWDAPPVPQPHVQPREARLAVDGEEVQIAACEGA